MPIEGLENIVLPVVVANDKKDTPTPSVMEAIQRAVELTAPHAAAFKAKPVLSFNPLSDSVIYVAQAEAACVATDCPVAYLGASDATSCVLVALRDAKLGVTALCHMDGSGKNQSLALLDLIRATKQKKNKQSILMEVEEETYDLYIVGGFADKHTYSILAELFQTYHTLVESSVTFRFEPTSCCFWSNNQDPNAKHGKPIFRNIVINTKTGEAMPATFTMPYLESPLRSLRFVAAGDSISLANVWDPVEHTLVIEPFDVSAVAHYAAVVKRMSDIDVLRSFSTTPTLEEKSFVPMLRAAFEYAASRAAREALRKKTRIEAQYVEAEGWVLVSND